MEQDRTGISIVKYMSTTSLASLGSCNLNRKLSTLASAELSRIVDICNSYQILQLQTPSHCKIYQE